MTRLTESLAANERPSSGALMSVELQISGRIEQRYFDICINYRLMEDHFTADPEWWNDRVYRRFTILFLSREELFNERRD